MHRIFYNSHAPADVYAVGYSSSYAQAIAHFVQCLRTGTPFETSAADHLAVFALVEAATAVPNALRAPRLRSA